MPTIKVFVLELWWIYSLICGEIVEEVFSQSGKNVHHTTIMIIQCHLDNKQSL